MSTLASTLFATGLAFSAVPVHAFEVGAMADVTVKPTPDFVPGALAGIEIEDHAGVDLPRDLAIRTHDGRNTTLGAYLGDGKPLIVVLAYYECPMLCTVVLNGLKDGLSGLAWTAGKEFRVLTVSFDKRDSTVAADTKRRAYLEAYGRDVGPSATSPSGWDFATASPNEVERLTKVLGFKYRWEAQTNQFAHSTGAFLFTPEGKLSVTMHGIVFPAKDLRMALNEAASGKLGTAWERVMLLCFHYDPLARSYVIAGTRLMKVGGVLTLLAMSLWLRRLFRRERERERELASPPILPPGTPAAEITS